jgi:hypothetical protein
MSDFGVSQANSQGQSLMSETMSYNQSAKEHNDQILRDYQGQKKQLGTSTKEDHYFHLLDDGYSLASAVSKVKQSYNVYNEGKAGAKVSTASTSAPALLKSKIEGTPAPEPVKAPSDFNVKNTKTIPVKAPEEPEVNRSSFAIADKPAESLTSEATPAKAPVKAVVAGGEEEASALAKGGKLAGSAAKIGGTALGILGF